MGAIAHRLTPPPLLALLADGRLHSGQALAGELGISRAAVWKAVARLRAAGIGIEAVRRRGYAYPGGFELLSAAAVRAGVSPACAARLRSVVVRFEVDSTNSRLLAATPPPAGTADVMLTELQHAGRGRRGRVWSAPFGAALALSVGWVFGDAARAAPSLSLCVGVAVARALRRAGAVGIGLKWPNDVWLGDRKVGGILLEVRAEANGPAHVVCGIGLNVTLPAALRARLERDGVLAAAVGDACAALPSRNFVAGAIIDELLRMLAEFERAGFVPFRQEWEACDVLRDRPASVVGAQSVLHGIARGVDAQGMLRLEQAGRMLEFTSGEVSLRLNGTEM